ncbi:hypothetical protein GCM10019996_04870 [Lentilactobacillus parakefiri]
MNGWAYVFYSFVLILLYSFDAPKWFMITYLVIGIIVTIYFAPQLSNQVQH